MLCIALYREKRKVTASDTHSSFSDVDRYSYRIDVRYRRCRGQLWTVLPVEFLRTREEEEYRSDNQEQENIDGTGEIEHRDGDKRSRRRYMAVTEL